MKDECLILTPLGLPVLPEVYITTETVSGAGGVYLGALGASAHTSSKASTFSPRHGGGPFSRSAADTRLEV